MTISARQLTTNGDGNVDGDDDDDGWNGKSEQTKRFCIYVN